MKKAVYLFLLISLVTFSACQKKQEAKVAPGEHAVTVVESMNASSYTYLKVSENGNEYWMAVPQMLVEKGETLYYSKSMEMKNFKSPSLNRTFDSILFVDHVSKTPTTVTDENQAQSLAAAHSKVQSAEEENVKIEPLKDGKTVAQVYKDMNALSGKSIKIKGKVTKFNGGIMDRNWIHIQDGTQYDGNFDLLVTSNDAAKVGDIITVEGTVATNKDFGAGYSYKVMLENAKILKNSNPM